MKNDLKEYSNPKSNFDYFEGFSELLKINIEMQAKIIECIDMVLKELKEIKEKV